MTSRPPPAVRQRFAVARAKQGDQRALHFLYVTYSDNVYGYVCSIVRDQHAAEDVTQQVFAKLITVISKYDDRRGAVLRVAAAARTQHGDRPSAG